MNLNDERLLEGNLISKEAKNQTMVIKSVEEVPDRPENKRTIKVIFEIVEGENEGFCVTEFYGMYEKMAWKLRILYCALGLYETRTRVKDGKEVKYKHVKEEIDEFALPGSILKADIYMEDTPDGAGSYPKLKNYQEV